MADSEITSKEEIKTDKRGIRDTIAKIFKELTEIRVVTAVGDVTVQLRPEHEGAVIKTDLSILPDASMNALVTIFDLIDGDVTTVISPALRDDEALRASHSSQVAESLKVLPDNIRALVDLGKTLIDELS